MPILKDTRVPTIDARALSGTVAPGSMLLILSMMASSFLSGTVKVFLSRSTSKPKYRPFRLKTK